MSSAASSVRTTPRQIRAITGRYVRSSVYSRAALRRAIGLIESTMPRDPVGVPGLAVVEGERLVPGGRVGGDVLPCEAHFQRHAVDDIVALEQADAVAEPADDGRGELAVTDRRGPPEPPDAAAKPADDGRVELAVTDRRGPPDPPEAGLGLEQPQRESFESGPPRELECVVRVDVPEAAEDRARLAVRLELDPFAVGFEEVDPLAVWPLPG